MPSAVAWAALLHQAVDLCQVVAWRMADDNQAAVRWADSNPQTTRLGRTDLTPDYRRLADSLPGDLTCACLAARWLMLGRHKQKEVCQRLGGSPTPHWLTSHWIWGIRLGQDRCLSERVPRAWRRSVDAPIASIGAHVSYQELSIAWEAG